PWNGEKELPQEEDPADGYQLRRDQSLVGVRPAERADEQEAGDEEQADRKHERRKIQGEHAVASGESQPCEGVGGSGTGEHLPQSHGDREDRAVEEEPAERRRSERGGEVFGMQAAQRVPLAQQRPG